MPVEVMPLLNYGVLGLVLGLLLTGRLVTKPHLDMVRDLADKSMAVSGQQVDATRRLSETVERAVEEMRRAEAQRRQEG